MHTWFSIIIRILTFNELAVVYFGYIFMIHVLDLVDETNILIHSFVILNKILFKIHNVLVGRLLGSQNVDGAKIFVLGALD